jgi:hypothetical protein
MQSIWRFWFEDGMYSKWEWRQNGDQREREREVQEMDGYLENQGRFVDKHIELGIETGTVAEGKMVDRNW